jgi:hypothetical protein
MQSNRNAAAEKAVLDFGKPKQSDPVLILSRFRLPIERAVVA